MKPIGCALLACAMAGCAGPHLYDSERDRQGQAARKAWSEVDLQASINAERANLDKLLAAEIETQQKLAQAIRDHELRSMVGRTIAEGLVKPVDQRLIKLAGDTSVQAEFRDQVLKMQARLSRAQNDFAQFLGIAAPQCSAVAKGNEPQYVKDWRKAAPPRLQQAMPAMLDDLRATCASQLSERELYKKLNGEIAKAWIEYESQSSELESSKKEIATLQSAYNRERVEYEKALAATVPSPAANAGLEAAAGTIHAAVEALKNSSSPYAARFLAEENLKAIDELAQAITQAKPGQPVPPDASRNAATFIVLRQFRDEVYTALAESKKPMLLPLLIRKNYEQLNLEAAQRDIAAREKMVRLSHDLVDVLYEQAEQLEIARNELSSVAALHQQPFLDAFTKSGPREREALYGAAARYLDAVNRLDARRYTIEYQRIAAQYEKALAYDEVSAKQWESLIGSSVSQVADYSASGFKPEQIANFLNTLGLFYIGVGTNK
jgi:hypothetical protein